MGRVEEIKRNQIYEIRDGGMVIYRGQTRIPLRERLKVHVGSAGSRDTLISDYIERVKEEGREDGLTIHEIGFESEKTAVAELRGSLLNEKPGKPRPRRYCGYDWTEEEASWLGEIPDKEICRRTGLGADMVRMAREKLGLETPAVKGSGHGFRFSDEKVFEIRQRHKNEDTTYSQLAEEYDVGKRSISRLVRGQNYDWVAHPEFDREEKAQIQELLAEGAGA
jgi:hypothetical protein